MPRIITNANTHIISGNPRCPLCASPAEVHRRKDPQDLFEGWCERCGNVRITVAAVEEAGRQGKKHLISAWLRRNGSEDKDFPITIRTKDVETILKDVPQYSVLDKLDRMLAQLSSKTPHPGHVSQFSVERDYPLVYATTPIEAVYYIRQLQGLGYVDARGGPTAVVVTAQGYMRLQELERTSRQSAFAFVAMWFDKGMDAVYEGAIDPAIREAGYKPIRIDRQEHTNRIDDEIIARIKGSRFMVADFTGQRAGVYFEAGMMMGLSRTTIWMCRKDELKGLHFDTRQYNFIDYETPDEARRRLRDRILAIEGQGPEVITN